MLPEYPKHGLEQHKHPTALSLKLHTPNPEDRFPHEYCQSNPQQQNRSKQSTLVKEGTWNARSLTLHPSVLIKTPPAIGLCKQTCMLSVTAQPVRSANGSPYLDGAGPNVDPLLCHSPLEQSLSSNKRGPQQLHHLHNCDASFKHMYLRAEGLGILKP